MIEQDYVMRLIKEMVRAILKLLLNIDTDLPTEDILKKSEHKEMLNTLLNMIDEGKINEAENKLYEIIENNSEASLEIAVLFYSYLNDKSEEFLEENNFSRNEIKHGLKQIATKHGLEGMAEMFLE